MAIRPLASIGALLAFLFSQSSSFGYSLKPAYAHLDFHWPLDVIVPPDDSGREFLLLQEGQILVLPEDRDAGEPSVFLDFTTRELEVDGRKTFTEEGLLGLAFHPQFAENKKFYLSYTMQNPKRTRLTEMQVGADGNADVETERILLEVRQPYWNHNSGNLLFGQDGKLFWSIGDGGMRDDITQLAQNTFTLNGSIVRIDPDTRTGSLNYGIPEDNPFFGKEGHREEIWAYGLRNPWGISIDPVTGVFHCADVGQDLFEEINVIKPGANYGWSFREGVTDFAGRRYDKPDDLELEDPIHVYDHVAGLSITGGFVYRGKAHPDLVGSYIFGDFVTGRIWALPVGADGEATGEARVLHDAGKKNAFRVSAISADSEGEILLSDWKGNLFELVR